MRQRGSLFAEVLISMLIFLIGMLALGSVLTFSLHMITCSGEALKADQDLINDIECYMLARVENHDIDPSTASAKRILRNKEVNIDGFTFNYSVYRYKTYDKHGSYYYVLQDE